MIGTLLRKVGLARSTAGWRLFSWRAVGGAITDLKLEAPADATEAALAAAALADVDEALRAADLRVDESTEALAAADGVARLTHHEEQLEGVEASIGPLNEYLRAALESGTDPQKFEDDLAATRHEVERLTARTPALAAYARGKSACLAQRRSAERQAVLRDLQQRAAAELAEAIAAIEREVPKLVLPLLEAHHLGRMAHSRAEEQQAAR
jgi:hypothetical protein